MPTIDEIKVHLIEQTRNEFSAGTPTHLIAKNNAQKLAAELFPNMPEDRAQKIRITDMVGKAAALAAKEMNEELGIKQVLSPAEFSRALFPDKQHPKSR